MTAPRCTGHCCRRFPLSTTLAHIQAIAAAVGQGTASEAGKIADMLIPLGGEDGREMFTCRHHDAETGDCRIYETRPRMCRDYPYGQACEHSECTAPPVLVQLRVEREPREVAVKLSAEMTKPLSSARAPEHQPGAKRPGFKSTPPLPRWARERKSRAPQAARARR